MRLPAGSIPEIRNGSWVAVVTPPGQGARGCGRGSKVRAAARVAPTLAGGTAPPRWSRQSSSFITLQREVGKGSVLSFAVLTLRHRRSRARTPGQVRAWSKTLCCRRLGAGRHEGVRARGRRDSGGEGGFGMEFGKRALESLGDPVCGNLGSDDPGGLSESKRFPYRSRIDSTEFFAENGTDRAHDSSARHRWVREPRTDSISGRPAAPGRTRCGLAAQCRLRPVQPFGRGAEPLLKDGVRCRQSEASGSRWSASSSFQ